MQNQSDRKIVVRMVNAQDETYEFAFFSPERVLQYMAAQIEGISKGKTKHITIFREDKYERQQQTIQQRVEQDLSQLYDLELLKQQLLLFDKDIDISNFIQTQKILASNISQQLTALSFSLIKISTELMQSKKPEIYIPIKQQKFSRQRLDKIQSDCLNTLMRVKEERKRIEACCICLTNRSTMIVFPCMHMVLCKTCCDPVSRCPICMQPISQIRQIFQ